MVQRYQFPVETQIGNVGDPTEVQDVVTLNYFNANAGGLILDTPGVFSNASVVSGNIVLTSALAAGSTNSLIVQTTGAAGTETAIQTFITGRGTSQFWAFAGFNAEAFTISANGSTASGQVTLTLGTAVTFPAISANTILQFATTNPTFTPVKDLVVGTNLTSTVGTNSQGRSTLTLNATGGGGSSSKIINIGESYVADNTGVLVKVLNTASNLSNITGSIANTVDYGGVNITSTPWPPVIPAGFNTNFVAITSGDNMTWGGVGNIQASPPAINQIAWVVPPTSTLTFTDARIWFVVNSVGANYVGTSNSDAQSRNPNTTLLYPELQLSQSTDGLGGNSARVITQPFIDGRIAALVGSASGATFLTPLTAVVIVQQGPSNVQLSIETLVDSGTLAMQLNALGAAASFIGTTANMLPDLPVTSWASTGVAGITLIVNLAASVTLAQAQSFFNNVRCNTVYYGATAQAGNYTFVPDVQGAVDARAFNFAQNNLLVGTGLSKTVDTTSQTVTLVNTGSGSGISSSNFTSFVNDLGQSLGTQGYVAFVSSADNTGWVALGMDSDVASNDGGFIGTTKYIGTTQGTAVSTYGYAVLYPVAATYTDLEIQVYVPAMVITFTSTFSSGWDIELYFSRASSTASSDPGLNANLFPGFRSGPSDLVSLNVLRASPVVFAPVSGQANTYTATISGGGLYSAITNGYAHTDTTNGYLPWVRIDGPAITGITSVVINQSSLNVGNSGGFRSLVAIPGVGGATPTLAQVLAVGNQTGNNPISFQDAATPPRQITLQAPSAISASYTLRWPTSQGTTSNTTLINDGVGNLSWGSPTLAQVLTSGGAANNLPITLSGTGLLTTPSLALGTTTTAITLRAPMTGLSNYALTLPAAAPNYGNTLVTTDAAGNTAWQPAGLELIRLVSTVNVTASGAQTVDGVAVALNDLVLLQNQTTTSQNGLYAVVLSGAWMKLTTYPSQSVFAQAGTTNINRTYTRNQTASPEQWIFTGNAGSGGGTPGGTNLSYQWNNSGAFAGDNAMFRDTINNRASVAAPVDSANVARFADVQAATAGIRPVDPQGIPVHISQSNLVGTYTNNSGVSSATLAGTTFLSIAGVTPMPGDIVLLTSQTAGLQNGSYTVNASTYTMNIIFGTPACFPTSATSVPVTFTSLSGGSANFTMVFAANQTLASAMSTRPANLDASWNYVFTGGNTATFTSVGTAVRWTTTPTVDITLPGGVTFQNGVPVTRTFTAFTPFLITRTSIVPTYGNFWVATATGASNLGVQFQNTTPGTITVGTTAITYSLFGIANPNLQAVTTAGNATNRGIAFQPTGSTNTNAITLTGSPSLSASQTYQLNIPTYPVIAGTPLICDPGGNLTFGPSLVIGNNSVSYLNLSASTISRPAGGGITLAAGPGGSDAVSIGNTNSSNFVTITGAAAGGSPLIVARGSDTNVTLNIRGSGTGQILLASHLNNYVTVSGAATGSGVTVAAAGGDTSVELNLAAKGLSGVNIGTNTANYIRISGDAAGSDPFIVPGGADTNRNLAIRGKGTGGAVLGFNGQFVSLGPPIPVAGAYTVPLYAANAATPSGNLTAGTSGMVLTSRGPLATPAWINPPTATTNIAIQVYALNGDQNLPATPFQFNTTATYTNGTAFGSFVSATQFAFSVTGYYFISFSYNVLSGVPDMSIVINGNRVAGATQGGKNTMTGGGVVTAANQVLSIQNYVSANFSSGQASLQIVKLV